MKINYVPNRVIDADGIADGASIYVYLPTTTSPVSLYADPLYTTPVSNPYTVAAGAAVPALYTNHPSVRVQIVTATGTENYDPYDPLSMDVPGVVSVSRDFGAKIGGIIDATAAIQAAINSGTKIIDFGDGDYKVTGLSVYNKSGLTLRGRGRILMSGTPVLGTHVLTFIQCSNITVEGLTIHGNNETRGGADGAHNISVYGCSDMTFRNVQSIYASGDGLYVNRAAGSVVINGITMSSSSIISSNLEFDTCKFDYAYRNNATVVACEGATFPNCVFSNSGKSAAGTIAPSAGVDLEPNDTVQYFPKRIMFPGCRWYNNTGAHLIINGRCYETTVDNPHFELGGSYGISNAGARTIVRNFLVKDTGVVGGSPRMSILNQSQTGSRASLLLEGGDITGAIFGGIAQTSYADLTIRNVKVSDGANYGLRLSVGSDPGDANKGFTNVEGMRIEKLFSSSPPSNAAYVMPGNYDGRLSLKGVRLLRTGATGTPIEIGAALALAPPTDIQEISDFNAIGTFATTAASGFSTARVLRNNKLNDVISDEFAIAGPLAVAGALSATGAATLSGGITSTSGSFSTTLAVTGVASLNGGMTSTTGSFSTSVTFGGGTPITKVVVYTPTLTPASVSAATVAEQTFTVTGVTTADKIVVNPPAIANATGIVGARVSAVDTVAIRFVNPTAGALTPTSGVYTIIAHRS
jgi:hypothetical protein